MVKHKIHRAFLALIKEKISNQTNVKIELQQSAANETKSTAGDKHETALAMLQIEQAQVDAKLEVLRIQLLELNQIDVEKVHTFAALGSLLISNNGSFYLSTALGKITIDDKIIFALSIKSPLGLLFLQKQKGDTFYFRELQYSILDIL